MDDDSNIAMSKEYEQEAVAVYMLFFYDSTKEKQPQIVMDWIWYSADRSHVQERFFLPFVNVLDNDDSEEEREEIANSIARLQYHTVCKSAIVCLLNFGYGQWKT